jgi:REP element-mobilizing transposase RayT
MIGNRCTFGPEKRAMSAAYTRLFVHLVWGTKERRPFLGAWRARRVHGLLDRIGHLNGCTPIAVGGVADHVHVLTAIPATITVADVVRLMKIGTSQFVARDLKVPDFEWQRGYGAFTLRETECEIVRRYIINQPAHHADATLIDQCERTSAPGPDGSSHADD